MEGTLGTFFGLCTPYPVRFADLRQHPGRLHVPDSGLFPHASNLRNLFIQIIGPSAPIFSHIAFPSLTTIEIDFEMATSITIPRPLFTLS